MQLSERTGLPTSCSSPDWTLRPKQWVWSIEQGRFKWKVHGRPEFQKPDTIDGNELLDDNTRKTWNVNICGMSKAIQSTLRMGFGGPSNDTYIFIQDARFQWKGWISVGYLQGSRGGTNRFLQMERLQDVPPSQNTSQRDELSYII